MVASFDCASRHHDNSEIGFLCRLAAAGNILAGDQLDIHALAQPLRNPSSGFGDFDNGSLRTAAAARGSLSAAPGPISATVFQQLLRRAANAASLRQQYTPSSAISRGSVAEAAFPRGSRSKADHLSAVKRPDDGIAWVSDPWEHCPRFATAAAWRKKASYCAQRRRHFAARRKAVENVALIGPGARKLHGRAQFESEPIIEVANRWTDSQRWARA